MGERGMMCGWVGGCLGALVNKVWTNPPSQSPVGRTHSHRRLYADLGQAFGSDPSYGFGDVMAKALGCSPIDLAAPEELLLDPPPAQR